MHLQGESDTSEVQPHAGRLLYVAARTEHRPRQIDEAASGERVLVALPPAQEGRQVCEAARRPDVHELVEVDHHQPARLASSARQHELVVLRRLCMRAAVREDGGHLPEGRHRALPSVRRVVVNKVEVLDPLPHVMSHPLAEDVRFVLEHSRHGQVKPTAARSTAACRAATSSAATSSAAASPAATAATGIVTVGVHALASMFRSQQVGTGLIAVALLSA